MKSEMKKMLAGIFVCTFPFLAALLLLIAGMYVEVIIAGGTSHTAYLVAEASAGIAWAAVLLYMFLSYDFDDKKGGV